MVGRLVEQQRGVGLPAGAVRGGEQDAGEFDTAALTTRQRVQGLAEDPVGQAEAVADARSLGFGDVSAERRETLFERTVLAHGAVADLLVDSLRHERLLLLHAAHDLVETSRREHPVLGEDVETALLGILRQVTDVAGTDHGAGVGFAFTREDPQGRGLAGTVASHEADPVPGLHPQPRAGGGEQRPHAGADFEVGSGDHARAPRTKDDGWVPWWQTAGHTNHPFYSDSTSLPR
ncbi:hypothetical protein AK37_07648 [Rhodococcus pyridinivorans AK37]|uniref:Uncharacterized protein n=1 Tax=Rhodococcus pyridinivorans AK37 TaxID=1114960 RepID=H0JPH4_9NOCA|nr:hypothetical protein AK37_07648 [Rhodococcus pyridinivorans AK37]